MKKIILTLIVSIIFCSTQIYSQWTAVNNGIPANTPTYGLTVNGQTLFATTYGKGVFKSTDNGNSWVASNNGLSGMSLVIMPIKTVGTQLFIGTVGGLFKSTDNGQSWVSVTNGLPAPSVTDFIQAITIGGSNIYLAYFNGGGVYKSTDNGGSWTKCPISAIYVNSIEANGDIVVLSLSFMGGLKISSDAGNTWKDISPGGSGTGLQQLAENTVGPIIFVGNDIYVGTGADILGDGCFFKSTNSGISWTKLIAGSISSQYLDIPVSFLYLNPNIVIGTDVGVQLYNITDGSRKNISDGLPLAAPNGGKTHVPNLVISSPYIFAEMDSLGIFRRNLTDIITGVAENKNTIPASFELLQNYPNPFNPTTTINYQLPESGFVKLNVYDLLGREVASLVNENKPAGNHSVKFDASRLTSGVYVYTVSVNKFTQSKKMLLMK
jgi:hypothetical protein